MYLKAALPTIHLWFLFWLLFFDFWRLTIRALASIVPETLLKAIILGLYELNFFMSEIRNGDKKFINHATIFAVWLTWVNKEIKNTKIKNSIKRKITNKSIITKQVLAKCAEVDKKAKKGQEIRLRDDSIAKSRL